jgi:hypothetical protein
MGTLVIAEPAALAAGLLKLVVQALLLSPSGIGEFTHCIANPRAGLPQQ